MCVGSLLRSIRDVRPTTSMFMLTPSLHIHLNECGCMQVEQSPATANLVLPEDAIGQVWPRHAR